MGNNPQNPIPSTFPKHCHKNLTFSKINPQQKTLQLKIPYNQHYHQWKWNLYPIQTYQKYLMLPKYFVDHGVHLIGCQSEENKKSFKSQLDILVGYQPYVYTLENQIMSRKFNDNFFTQKEIWKIVKSSLLALQCWNHAYNDIQIGGLVQKNILFNAEGQIKIVHHFSFPPEGLITYNNKVIQYETINPRNTITKGKTHENTILTNSLYTLGLTLLNMINVDMIKIFNLIFLRLAYSLSNQKMLYFICQRNVYPKNRNSWNSLFLQLGLDVNSLHPHKKQLKFYDIYQSIIYMVFNLAYKGIFDTYLMDDSTMFKNVQVKDALYKIQIYFAKIIKSNGSFGQIQKICHLAAETCTKFSDNHQFNQKLYIRLIYLIAQSRNYFLLYLLDILIKNTRQIMKQAKNDIVRLFKLVWEQAWQEYKNNLKLECLKAMVKTWNLIYSSQNIQQSVETWLRQNYGSNLTLQKKYQDIYLEVYEKYKPVEKKEKEKEKVENQVIKSQQERRNQAAYQQLLISLQ